MSEHRPVHTEDAPAALGPYSQAVTLPIGERTLIFAAGQIPVDPASGEPVEGPVEAQVERVMRNLEAVLQEAGSGLDRVVKTTIFLTDLDDFESVNATYGRYFDAAPPARATVQVARLPKGVAVEIEAVAYR